MNDKQLLLQAKSLLIKIAVITGWVTPQNEQLVTLVNQFSKKLSESYRNCNPEEIEYAFRNFSAEVKDWGKNVNLTLIDDVMRPYLIRRREQSDAEERAAPALPVKAMRVITDQEWFEMEVQLIKTGKPFEFVPVALYEHLKAQGKIKLTAALKQEYTQRAVAWRLGQLQKECEIRNSAENQHRLQDFRKMQQQGYCTGSEIDIVLDIAKKLVFFDYVLKNC